MTVHEKKHPNIDPLVQLNAAAADPAGKVNSGAHMWSYLPFIHFCC